ncbi:Uncharacterised protein [Klebsiella pneumoniae]|nr:Uncharacterised protein [Klebsiella pneumoniae]
MINHSQFCFRGILWFSHKIAPYSVGCPTFGVQSMRLYGPKRQPDSSLSLRERARVRGSTAVLLFSYRWLQRSLRSRLIVCAMSLMAQGAHSGRPVAAAPCTPGLRPATSPLRGAFDLSLQASGRAEAASVQNTALSPHPCGLPRPSGNVSAMLRPPAPAVSAAPGPAVIWAVGRVRRSRHPAKSRIPCLISCPAALRLHGPTGCEPVSGSCRSGKRSATRQNNRASADLTSSGALR